MLEAPLEFFKALRAQLKDDTGTGPKAIQSLARANMDLAFTTFEIGSIPDAIRSGSEAIAVMDRLTLADPANADYQKDLAKSHNAMGIMQQQNGQHDQALESFSRALEIQERLAQSTPISSNSRAKSLRAMTTSVTSR